jgi:hypothetical protein
MPRLTRLVLACLALLLLCGAPAGAAPLTITFETLPGADGKLGTADDVDASDEFLVALQDQYAAVGLSFSQGSLLRWDFFDGNDDNHFISSTAPVATLSAPVFGISIESKSYWDAFLTAYDSAGNIIGTSVLLNPNAGQGPLSGMLSLTTTQAIAGFSIMADQPNHILNLDNLVLDVAAVPEPAPLFLLGLGALMLGAQRRPRRK